MNILFLCFILTSPVTGAFWSFSRKPQHHEEVTNRNTKVWSLPHEDSEINARGGFASTGEFFDKCTHKLRNVFAKTKNIVYEGSQGTNAFHDLEGHAKEVIDKSVGKVGDPKEKLFQKLSEKVISVGEKVIEAAVPVYAYVVGKTIDMVSLGDTMEGTLKDTLVKIDEWDLVESPKRIGEDIKQNVTRKIEQLVEVVKEIVETVKETSLIDLLRRPKKVIRSMISWCHLLGFSTAYGIGVWVTFFSSCVLGKCLPKQQFEIVLNKMNMVYFRAMSYCVGVALFGYLVSQGRKGVSSYNMEMFQGFNLLSALLMILTNLIFLELRATKLIIERMKIYKEETGEIKRVAEKLKKLNTYSSTLVVSTMVVLTWHVSYIGQLLQFRHF